MNGQLNKPDNTKAKAQGKTNQTACLEMYCNVAIWLTMGGKAPVKIKCLMSTFVELIQPG